MSNNQEQIAPLEVSIEEAKNTVAMMDSARNLINNSDFKKVIDDNYFKGEASRLVLLKADPQMQGEEDQKDIMRALDAIGNFRQYLSTIFQLGRLAEKTIADAQKAINELESEAE